MKGAAAIGIGLSALVGLVVWAVADVRAALVAGAFGVLATVIHLAALRALMPALGQPFRRLMGRVALGMALRLAGAVVWAAAVLIDRQHVPPLAAAVGYVGVLIPLLFTELRLLR